MRKSIKDSLDINGIMKRRCGESCDGPVIAQAVVSSCTSEQACAARWCQYINETLISYERGTYASAHSRALTSWNFCGDCGTGNYDNDGINFYAYSQISCTGFIKFAHGYLDIANI